jgi:uncharacterized protein (TIGR02099 family)
MVDLTPKPSSLLRKYAALARWSLGVVLAAWLVFGVAWGALHWLIVPRIGELRPLLEARAAQLIGVPVRIGSISAYSTGLVPSFELTDVQLLDPQGRAALDLPRVLVALSPRSVARLGFEQLYIEKPELSIRRTPDGKIRVAGFDFSKAPDASYDAAEWFFSQIEFAIRDGTVQWTDELRGAPPLALQQVDLVVRNQGRRHEMRLDATPPAAWGERFSLRGLLTQPLLSRSKSRWQDWSGQLYAAFERVDVSELRRYTDTGVDVRQGEGALRAWVDISRGQVVGGAADVALSEVTATLGGELQALELQSVRGRLGGRVLANGFEFSTRALAFDTRDGLRWPGGNFSLMHLGAEGKISARGEFKADRLDLAALAQIASRLPIDAPSRAAWLQHAPQGLVEQVQATWLGPVGSPQQYSVQGAVSGLALAAVSDVPGLHGARVEFDFNQASGKASVALLDGAIALPGFFEEPVVPLTRLSGDVRWQVQGEHIAVQMPNLKFSNADAQGEAQLKWHTGDPGIDPASARFPGVLDLQGTLSRADATRVHRYLPLVIEAPVRHYVRDAIQAGSANAVKFRVKGDLHKMPFADARQGEFRIAADVKNATYAFVPPGLQPADALPWPSLTQLQGELVVDRKQLQVRAARARLGASTSLQANKIEALIPDLAHAVVAVNAEVRGPLPQALGVVNGSPVGEMMGHALGRASATGLADYRLKLSLPIATIDTSTVQGSVILAGNDIQISPDSPRLGRARGVVNFTDNSFSIVGGQAQLLGGEARLEGGSPVLGGTHGPASAHRPAVPIVIRASGTASADGLRQASELGFVARLAQHASGSAAYSAVLGFPRGESELSVTSDLQGLGLNLPAPLNKAPQTSLPLRLETTRLDDSQEQFKLDLGGLAAITYVRDSTGPLARVRRGSLAVGLSPQESAPLPAQGVVANINLSQLDLDAWETLLAQVAGGGAADSATGYLPTSVALRARELTVGGRDLHEVVLGGSREGQVWRANVHATELNGFLQYRQPLGASEGLVFARLARLNLAPGVDREVEALLAEQPVSIPALDIVVDDFELRGKRLGRVEVEAINRSAGSATREDGLREWRLNKFNMSTPEAVLTASGSWTAAQPLARRRTVMNFKLDITDSGELLTRLGMKDLVRRGQGRMEGQVAWAGSPITLDYGSMTGAFTVNVESGQFLQADPGIAKLLGVLSLQSLPRRLTLDFRDVFSDGFAFDFLRGDVAIEQGIARTNNLQMKGVNAAVLMEGRADIARETQDIKVVVVPEVNAGTASLIASVINPAVGLGTFLAQMFLRRPLTEAATQEFHISGGWADPKIARVLRPSVTSKEASP